MNSRERVIRTIERTNPDRIPVDIWASYPFLVKLLKYFGYGEAAVHPHLDKEGVMDKIYDSLGIDLRTTMVEPPEEFRKRAVFDPRFHFPWGIKIGEDTLVDEWGVVRQLNVTKTQSRIIKYPLRDTPLEEYTFPDPYAPDRFTTVEKQIKTWGGKYAIIGYPGGDPFFSQAWYLLGFNETISKMYRDPHYIRKLFDKLLWFFTEVCKQLIEKGVDMIMIADDVGAQTGMILPPKLWRELVKPYLRELVRQIRKRGVYVIYHSDGYIEPIIPDLIEIGVQILNPIQPECMNPAEIKKKYGDKLTLYGTISIQKTLPYGTVEDVENEVKHRIATCGYDGGLIISPSNQVLVDTKIENFLAIYEAVKKYGRFPIKIAS
jgi:uroporphyrinogen decarboxylase